MNLFLYRQNHLLDCLFSENLLSLLNFIGDFNVIDNLLSEFWLFSELRLSATAHL